MTIGATKYIQKFLLVLLFMLAGVSATGQTWNMVNGDTVRIDACQWASGNIYDDGGSNGNYSDNFDGWVILEANYGSTIVLSIRHRLEYGYDYINVWDNDSLRSYHQTGTQYPGDSVIHCTSGRAKIQFHSDGSSTDAGLNISYYVEGGVNTSNGVIGLTASSITTTGATLQWTSGGNGPFHILCDDPVGDTLTTTSTNYVLTGLSPAMRHSVEVYSEQLASHRCAIGKLQLRTACGTSRLPLKEDFNDVTTDEMTPCWTRSVNFDDEYSLPRVVSFDNGDKAQMLSCGSNNTGGHFGMITTPRLKSNASQWRVRFKMRVSHANTKVVVGFCDSTSDEQQSFGFTPVETLSPATNDWIQINKTYTVPAGGCRLAFRMLQSMQGGTGRMVYFDDMVIESCAVTEGRTMHADLTSFDVYWSTVGNPDVTVRVRPEWDTVDDQIFEHATSPITVTGLQPGRNYEITFFPLCDGVQQTPLLLRASTMPARFDTTLCTDLPVYNYLTNVHELPTGWNALSSSYYTVTPSSGIVCLGRDCILVSPALASPGGKELMVRPHTPYPATSRLAVGTMTYPDDPSSFTPFDTIEVRSLDYPDTAVRLPVGMTDRYVALKSLCPNDAYIQISAVSLNNGHVEGERVVKVKSTQITLAWNSPSDDTVLIDYTNSSGQQVTDTVVNATQTTITGLTPNEMYSFYFHLPGDPYCAPVDQRNSPTARRDYEIPYCENFSDFYPDESFGWRIYDNLLGYPDNSVEYVHSADSSLKMAAASNGFVSTIGLPIIENIGGSVLSFWAYTLVPSSMIIVGYYLDDNYIFHEIDTLPIAGNVGWRHYSCNLPADLDARLALRYMMDETEGIGYIWIDDLSLGPANYGDFTYANLTGNEVDIVFQNAGTTDSITVMLVSQGDTVWATGVPDTIHISGLTPMRYYDCYVVPNGGCITMASRFFTLDYSVDLDDYHMCFTMDSLLSYELPPRWSFSDSTRVSLVSDDHGGYSLQMISPATPGLWNTATLPNISYNTLYFIARGLGNGVLLAVGGDTVSLDTVWRPYAFQPTSPTTISISGGTGCLLDSVSLSPCPGVTFSVEGNTLTVHALGNQFYEYLLHLSDGEGDNRDFHVTTPVDSTPDLQPLTTYHVSWECLYMDNGCIPTVDITTQAIPLPYCINFEDNNSNLPAGWIVVQRDGYEDVTFEGTDYMRFNAGYDRWNYIILPKMEYCDNMMLYLQGYFSGQDLEIGHLSNGSDTASFVADTVIPYMAMSMNTTYSFGLHNTGTNHVALRYRGYSLVLRRLGISRDPKMHFHIYSPSTLTIDAETDTVYQFAYQNRTNGIWYNKTATTNPTTIPFIPLNQSGSLYTSIRQQKGLPDCTPIWDIRRSLTMDIPYCDEIFNDELYNIYTTYPQEWAYVSFQYQDDRDCYLMRAWDIRPVLLIFPYINNAPTSDVKFSFEYKAMHVGDAIEVGVLTDFLDTASFIPIDTLHFPNAGWNKMYVDLSNYTGDSRWIALRAKKSLLDNDLYIDNLRFDRCYLPTNTTLHLERYNEVVIDGEISPEANGSFWVEYGPEGFEQGHGTMVQCDSFPVHLTLEPSTTYAIYLYCTNNRQGCNNYYVISTLDLPLSVPSCTSFDQIPTGTLPPGWTAVRGPVAVSDLVAHGGTQSLAVCGTVSTPDIDIDSLNQLAAGFWLKATQPGAYLVVGTMTDPTDLSSFHPIKTIVPRQVGGWEYHFINFSEAPSNAHFIAFRNPTGNNCNIYVDEFLLTLCVAFDMNISRLENDFIELSWQQIGTPQATLTVFDSTAQTTSTYNLSEQANARLTIPIIPQHVYQITTLSSCPEEGMPCAVTYTDTILIAIPAEGFGCVDPTDLTSPQAVFLSGSYSNPYANRGVVDFGASRPESRHTVNRDTTARDPRTGNLLRTIPPGHTSSVRLGNWRTNSAMPEAEGVIYSLRVDTLDFSLLLMQYAAVLQDPMHAPEDQPRFRLELLDSNYNLIDPECAAADFIANRNLGWNTAQNNVLWKDWTTVGVDLTAFHGQQVFLRLTTYDCNEGSHYGYAYFTLECLHKNIRTETCGNVASNVFSAPSGFNYRWYTTTDNTTLSTEQSIEVPNSASTVYLCDLSFLNNPSCMFTLSAFGGTRYPLARVDTVVSYSNCRINVQFINRSTVSSDGINATNTNEMAETAFWDYGNGMTSDSYNGYASYEQPGTYMVTLVAGISGGECTDTLTFPITIDFPTHAVLSGPDTLCDGILDTLHLFGAQTLDSSWKQGTAGQYLPLSPDNYSLGDNDYTLLATDPYGCSLSLSNSLQVNPSYTHFDSLHLCSPEFPLSYADTLFLPGTTDLDYHQPGLTTLGCDSSFHLHLKVSPLLPSTVLDTLQASICDNQSYLFYGDTIFPHNTTPITHHSSFIDSLGRCDSLHYLVLEVRPTAAVDTTVHACHSFDLGAFFHLSENEGIILYSDSTLCHLDTNVFLCDSLTTLTLYIHPVYEVTDSIVVCPKQQYVYEGVDYGGPVAFQSPHLTVYGCDSLVNVVLYASDPAFPAPPEVSLDGNEWFPTDTLLLGCALQPLWLRDTSPSVERQWLLWGGDSLITHNSSLFTHHSSLDVGLYAFQLITVSSEGCRDTVGNDSLLWVFPSPKADFSWSPDYLPFHDPKAQFHNFSQPDSCSWLWLFSSGGDGRDTSLEENPSYEWEPNITPGDYEVSLVAFWTHIVPGLEDTVVCTDTATWQVTIVNTWLQFPNLVTPNGDGNNDIWKVVNLLEMGEYSMNELWIYDRWGAEVYHVKDISEEKDFWNPLATHSPDGTYYYRFMAKSAFGIVKRNGVIEVIR